MFNVIKKRRRILDNAKRDEKGPPGVAVVVASGPPKGGEMSKSPMHDDASLEGDEESIGGGDQAERQKRAEILCAHHQELADHFRQCAMGDESEEQPGDEALESPDDQAEEDAAGTEAHGGGRY